MIVEDGRTRSREVNPRQAWILGFPVISSEYSIPEAVRVLKRASLTTGVPLSVASQPKEYQAALDLYAKPQAEVNEGNFPANFRVITDRVHSIGQRLVTPNIARVSAVFGDKYAGFIELADNGDVISIQLEILARGLKGESTRVRDFLQHHSGKSRIHPRRLKW